MPSPPTTPHLRRTKWQRPRNLMATPTTTTTPASLKLRRAKLKSISLEHEYFPTTNHIQQSWSTSYYSSDWSPSSPDRSTTEIQTNSVIALTSAVNTNPTTNSLTNNYQQKLKADIIRDGKCLCGQYIRARLRRAGILNRKLLLRLHNIWGGQQFQQQQQQQQQQSSDIIRNIFPIINNLSVELEHLHSGIYVNIYQQLTGLPTSKAMDCETAMILLNLLAKELYHDIDTITWCKIISIFSVCGGLAVDCVRQGHHDYIKYLIDTVAGIIEDDLMNWLIDNGGWLDLQKYAPPALHQTKRALNLLEWLTIVFIIFLAIYFIIITIIKHNFQFN